ncbi:MAG: protein arginine kinase [Planctomycetota bacterium]|nr:protein arginine kinase [Planctomycetota bacterium]
MNSIVSDGVGEWLSGTGPESDIVMSTRIRLARNVASYPFLSRIAAPRRSELERLLKGRLEKADFAGSINYHNLTEISALERQCLVERHLISREHEEAEGDRGVALGADESLSIMVNEEDHLRLQVLRSGFQVDAAWEQLRNVDDRLESSIDYAFSTRFGYLTACPTNVGTGLRVSVMLHLPALVLSKTIKRVFRHITDINLAVRGFYGEGTQPSGDFFQISNQVTLGKSEEEIIRHIASHVPQIIKHERIKREQLIEKNRLKFEDRVWRAYGMLERARSITSEETMDYLSAVRMGVHLGLIDTIPIGLVNEFFILTQPAHLQLQEDRELDAEERNQKRANLIRERLAKYR